MKHIDQLPFIVIEGPDGVGKTTLCGWISEEFGYKKYKCMGETFYKANSYFEEGKVSTIERFSFLCGEAINNSFVIKKELKSGNKIIFDRYYYSTLAYSEIAEKGVTKDFMFLFNQLPQPDFVFLVIADFDTMIKRIEKRGDLSILGNKFNQKENYNTLINNYKNFINEKMILLDNNGEIEEVKKVVRQIIKSRNGMSLLTILIVCIYHLL